MNDDLTAANRPPRTLPNALAILMLTALSLTLYSSVWRAGASRVVPRATRSTLGEVSPPVFQRYADEDTILATWLVTRNAHTLTHRPWQLFETEHCAPHRTTLAFGEPMITLGILAIPGSFISSSPLTTYNLALFALYVVSALAMYVLVSDWTGSIAAALTAALLYAFHAERIADVTHSFIYDTAWIALAICFARRWLACGRWSDALALAACGALQLGTSVYPILASAVMSVSIGLGLLRAYGLPRERLPQLVAILALVALAAYTVFSPYVALQSADPSLQREVRYFAGWDWFIPHRHAGIAWITVALAAVSLLVPTRSLAHGDSGRARLLPWWVAGGAIAVLCTATGPNQPAAWQALWEGKPPFGLPDLYAALAAFLPILESVRVPARVASGYHLGLCLLAGLGAASLIERSGRVRNVVALAVIVFAAAETWILVDPVRPTADRDSLLEAAPAPDDIEFFAALARLGNDGPLLELPIGNVDREYVFRNARRMLLTAYHGRRTSACYGSFLPPGRVELRLDSLALPDAGPTERLCALGFTTVVVQLDTPLGRDIVARFEQAAAKGTVRYLATNGTLSAFTLCDAVVPSRGG